MFNQGRYPSLLRVCIVTTSTALARGIDKESHPERSVLGVDLAAEACEAGEAGWELSQTP
eukprot:3933865-Rhodomonas_salina.1